VIRALRTSLPVVDIG